VAEATKSSKQSGSLMVSGVLEFHAFGLSTIQSRGPLIFITATGAVCREGPNGFCTSAEVKRRFAWLLDLRVSALKFYPEVELNKFLRQGSLRASVNLLDPKLSMDELYTVPLVIIENFNLGKALLRKNLYGSQLRKLIAASWLMEDNPLTNLVQLCNATSTSLECCSTATAFSSGCQVRCSRCGIWFPVPGSRTPCSGSHKCSCCRGDPEGMRIIARMALALRFGADGAWEPLCIRLRRAIKAGHAEAVRAIALARTDVCLSSAELDLAIRSRRAGILASILSRSPADVIHSCLRPTELHALAENTFGGHRETKLFFDDLRRRLSGAHKLIMKDKRPLEILQKVGWLAACRQGLPRPTRHLIWQFLSTDISARICCQLAEVIAGIDGLEVRLDNVRQHG